MTRVVHCKKAKYDVYIGRPSKWGNKYVIGKDGDRDECIDKYKKDAENNPKLISELPELKDRVLGCWCAPLRCHDNVLIELIEKYVK